MMEAKKKKKKRPNSAFVAMSSKMESKEDWISALPDEILRYILSFLATKFAFTTTVLSKRWTPLSHSLTTLHFDDEAEQDEETYLRFRRFVDKVLLSPYVQHQPIKTLSLASRSKLCDLHPRRFNAKEWIEAAKRRQVVNLNVSSRVQYLHLSPNIFTFRTLVVLKLLDVDVDHQVGSVDFPSLTTLHLIAVLFQKKDDVTTVLNACPSVVDLYCSTGCYEFPCYPLGFKPLPKVVKARICAFNLPLTAIYNVESLRIEKMDHRAKDKYIDSYYRRMPVFQNLISIELSILLLPSWDTVVEVLPYCPKLQSLVIDKRANMLDYQRDWASTKPVPECLSSHLRTCSIGNYYIRGRFDDFDFAAYILQNARVLQVLTLHISPFIDESEKDRFLKYLSKWCPSISPACKIELK